MKRPSPAAFSFLSSGLGVAGVAAIVVDARVVAALFSLAAASSLAAIVVAFRDRATWDSSR